MAVLRLLACLLFVFGVVISGSAKYGAEASSFASGSTRFQLSRGHNCDKSLGECLLDQEFQFDSEIHRRYLAQQQYYISYQSLSAGRTPCPAGSGRSYYTNNCKSASGSANPYKRGCSTITRCQRDSS